MDKKKYVYWEDEGVWLGYLVEYPDYMTQGETFEELKENLSKIKKFKVPVWRKNVDNKWVTVPVDKLDYYLGNGFQEAIEFYIAKDWKNELIEHKQPAKAETEDMPPAEKLKIFGQVENQIKKFKNISIVEREEILDECLERFHELEKSNAKIARG